jgi:hypothetical protein
MNPENLWYWRRGFNYNRSHVIENKVAVEVYRILIHYTAVHKNCRVGAYLSKSSFSEFCPLSQIISNFDFFSEVATTKKKVLPDIYPEHIKDIWGPTFHEQVENVWRLQWPIWFEYESKCWVKEIFGYKFNRADKAFSLKIAPEDIKELTGDSLRNFSIGIKDYTLRVNFGNEISIV